MKDLLVTIMYAVIVVVTAINHLPTQMKMCPIPPITANRPPLLTINQKASYDNVMYDDTFAAGQKLLPDIAI